MQFQEISKECVQSKLCSYFKTIAIIIGRVHLPGTPLAFDICAKCALEAGNWENSQKQLKKKKKNFFFRRWDVSQNKDALNLKWCSLAFLSFIKRTDWFSRITESKNPRLTFFTVIRHSRKLMWYLKCLFQIKTKQVEI